MNPHADSVQQPSDEQCYAVPLVELLKRVPQDARLAIEWPPEQGIGTSFIPVGRYCHEAAEALARFGTRPAAEPSQSGSAGEALLATAPKFEECETPEPSLSSLIYRYYRAHFEDRAQADGYASRYIAALSRQAPAAPAEAGRSDQWGRLYTTANTLVASIGYMGEIDSRADEVASLMDALHDLDGGQWMPGLTPAASPAAPTQALLGWTRYEKARKLNVAQWAELHQRNLRGEPFDDMIDALPATTQPVQQDTRNRCIKCGRPLSSDDWHTCDSCAEKQAAPSGEDNHG